MKSPHRNEIDICDPR